MTLDEAIEMYTNNAEYERTHGNLQGCLDFKQLVEWLKELKAYRDNRGISIEDFEEAMDALQQPCEEYKAKMEVDKLCD